MSAQQNLVPNGSFEIFDTCPQFPDQVHLAKGWFRPTSGSSDYFNSCDALGFMSTPLNDFGYKIPFHGNAYCGFLGYINNFDYNEYISCKLISTLQKDVVYNISYYVALSGKSDYAINSLGMYISNDSIYQNNSNVFSSLTPQIISNSFIVDTLSWTKISGSYKSIGGENFITIGNFKPFNLTDTIRSYGISFGSYYFVDSVSIYHNENINDIPNIFTPNGDGVNDIWKCYFPSTKMCTVFNRWGNKIYITTNNKIEWDGRTTSGIECTDGSYYYLIQTETENHKGFIQLMR